MKAIVGGWIRAFQESIQLRLTASFIVILIPLTAVSLYINARSHTILSSETNERIHAAMNGAIEYIDLTLAGLDELSILLSNDQNLLQVLNQGRGLTPDLVVDLTHVLDQVTSVAAHNRILSEVAVYHESSGMLISSSFGGQVVGDPLLKELHESAVSAMGGRQVHVAEPGSAGRSVPRIMAPFYDPANVTFYRRMDLNRSYDANHLLLMTVPQKQLGAFFSSLAAEGSQSIIYLLDDQGQRIAGTGAALDEEHFPDWDSLSGAPKLTGVPGLSGKWFVTRVQSPDTHWSLVMLLPEEELLVHTKPMERFTYGIIVLSLLLSLTVSWLIYSQIASPLSRLTAAMKLMQIGKRDVEIQTDRKDEFGNIMRVFNQMAKDNRHLIEDIYENKLRLTQTEMKFLQSQIHPHFLYNTLDCIYWMSKNYDADEIGEMVMNLSKFFRLSLNSGGETFTVAETVEHLKYYVRVQQLRFAESFAVEYEVDEDALQVPVLKLILQPFVENAIVHGMEEVVSGGRIRIQVAVRDGSLVAVIEDNGSGIPEERLAQIRSELAEAAEPPQDGTGAAERVSRFFGLKNVMSRLKLYYGEGADIRIESEEGRGTKVTVLIPLRGEIDREAADR